MYKLFSTTLFLFATIVNASTFHDSELGYLGKVAINHYENSAVLGISAIRYDKSTNNLILLSDDTGTIKNHYGQYGNARHYRISLDHVWDQKTEEVLSLSPSKIPVLETKLRAPSLMYNWLNDGHVDLEGMAITNDNDFLLASEQGATYLLSANPPFIHIPELNVESKLLRTSPSGKIKAEYTFPSYFRNTCWKWSTFLNWDCSVTKKYGLQRNKGIESIDRLDTLGEIERFIAITEAPLTQDINSLSKSMDYVPSRLLKFGLPQQSGEVVDLEQFFYPFEQLPSDITEGAKKGYPRRGVSDLVVLDSHTAFTIERNFILYKDGAKEPRSYTELFVVELDKPTPHTKLEGKLIGSPEPYTVNKHLLLPTEALESMVQEKESENLLSKLNIEGITFGPNLEDGSKLLILVNDNGASDKLPGETWLLFFRLPSGALPCMTDQSNKQCVLR